MGEAQHNATPSADEVVGIDRAMDAASGVRIRFHDPCGDGPLEVPGIIERALIRSGIGRIVASARFDEQRISDGDQLLALLARFGQVRGLLSGHVHQQWDAMAGPVRVMTSPSTSIQFAPNSDDFSVDALGPGYRWLKLYPGGELETGVERVDAAAFPVDRRANGY